MKTPIDAAYYKVYRGENQHKENGKSTSIDED